MKNYFLMSVLVPKELEKSKVRPPGLTMRGMVAVLFMLMMLGGVVQSLAADADWTRDLQRFTVTYDASKCRYEFTIYYFDGNGDDSWLDGVYLQMSPSADYRNTSTCTNLLYIKSSFQNDENKSPYPVDLSFPEDNGKGKVFVETNQGWQKMSTDVAHCSCNNNNKRAYFKAYWYPPRIWNGTDISGANLKFQLSGKYNRHDCDDQYLPGADSRMPISSTFATPNVKGSFASNGWGSDGSMDYTITNASIENVYDASAEYHCVIDNNGNTTDMKLSDYKGKVDLKKYLYQGASVSFYSRVYPDHLSNGGFYFDVVTPSKSLSPIAMLTHSNNLNVFRDNSKFTLSWTPAALSGAASNMYTLQVKKGDQGEWKQISNTVNVSSTSSYDYTLPTNDLNNNNVNYYFKLSNNSFSEMNNVTQSDNNAYDLYQESACQNVNTNVCKFSSYDCTVDKSGVASVKWGLGTGIWPDGVQYKMTVSGGTTSVSIPTTIGPGDRMASVSGLASCTTYSIKTQILYNNVVIDEKTASVSPPNTDEHVIKSIKASKGYYNDRVLVNWVVGDNSNFDYYEVHRQAYNDDGSTTGKENVLLTQISHSTNSYTYTDNSAEAGIYYNYTVTGVAKCNANTTTVAMSDLGFSQPYATVSGRISFKNGNQSVEGADVLVVGSDSTSNRSIVNTANSSTVKVPVTSFGSAGWSMQCWVKPESSTVDTYLFTAVGSKTSTYVTINKDQSITFEQQGEKCFIKTNTNVIPFGKFSHITITSSGGTNPTLNIYVNGIKQAVASRTNTLTSSDVIDYKYVNVFFGNNIKGEFDEFRLWNKELTAAEVENNYDRYISGKEDNLLVYYRFDEKFGNKAYDLSAVGNTFNKNDGDLASSNTVVHRVSGLSSAQLAIKGKTDTDGNYIINTIPYTTNGMMYNVIPTKASHAFSPSQKPIFASSDSKTFSDFNFEDNSSFPVKVKVTYKNTDIPVDGVSPYVDGVICTNGENPITTDANGMATISVSIGDHYITMKKSGHTFVNGGRYPKAIEGKVTTKEYTAPVTDPITFSDATTMTVIGRVVGGDVQGKKPYGMGQSKANIGKATIDLQLTNGGVYNLNVDSLTGKLATTRRVIADSSQYVNSYAYVDNVLATKDHVYIKTDSVTGEFAVQLPPLSYTVKNISTKDFDKNDLGMAALSKIEVSNINSLTTDTVTLANGTKRFYSYHYKMPVIYYSEPTFEVVDLDAKAGMYGDEKLTLKDKSKVNLYDATAKTYAMGNPVFTQHYKYNWRLSARQYYLNHDVDNTTVTDTVRLNGLSVNVANEMAHQSVVVNPDSVKDGAVHTYGELYSYESSDLTLNSKGEVDYSFMPEYPNVASPYTWGVSMTYVINGRTYTWPADGNKFKATVLGYLPQGNNFVTAGPDEVSMVLRDPPGSGSFATYSKGTSTTVTKTTGYTTDEDAQGSLTFHYGTDTEIWIGGLTIGNIDKADALADIKVGVEDKTTNEGFNTTVTTTTLTRDISTSSENDYVGAMGDVFIGRSQNIVFGLATTLGITKDGSGNLSYNKSSAISEGEKYGTAFNYTQDYIENILIPNLHSLRDSKIEVVSAAEYAQGADASNNSTHVRYISQIGKDDPNFGQKGYYVAIKPKKLAKLDLVYSDSVAWCNSQVKLWENTLAENEEAKVKAFENRSNYLKDNHSFDAGTTYTETVTNEQTDTEIRNSTTTASVILGDKTGFDFNGLGFDLEIQNTFTAGGISNSQTDNMNSTETSYTLADTDQGDAYTVDVLTDPIHKEFSPIFRVRAGQTSCPYQDQEVTKYYKPGTEIGAKTVQIEMPKITSDGNVKSDVPAGSAATYTIHCTNQSAANMDTHFVLSLVDGTNPKGAILTMDGTPLTGTDSRTVLVPAEKALDKTITLSQTKKDVLDYDSIAIVLRSKCQGDPTSNVGAIADTLYLSAHFTPTCSNITLQIDDRTLNTNVSGNTLKIKVKDYDATYKNLKGIRIQYMSAGALDWITAKEYTTDNTKVTGAISLLPSGGIEYPFDMTSLSDGTYKFRAITMCAYGTDIINNESDEITVVKDVVRPASMGQPSPSNGILTAGDEVSVVFNEDILSSKLSNSNISVTGVPNGYATDHSVGLTFAGGNNVANTESNIALNSSFSLEGWTRHELGKAGTIWSYGSDENSISLGFDADNKLVAKVNNETFTSEKADAETYWQYVVMAYDRTKNTLTCSVSGTTVGNETLISKSLTTSNSAPAYGRLYIGNTKDANNGYYGKLSAIHLWNTARVLSDYYVDMNKSKIGNETGLIGYWNLEEGEGTTAKDKARSHTMNISTNWFTVPSGKSIALDGKTNVTFPSATFPFGVNNDFTWELWMKSDSEQDATLLSAGDGMKSSDVDNNLSVAINTTGNILLRAKGHEYTVCSSNLSDGKWHHVALSVCRTNNANVYVDGTKTYSMQASNIGNVQAASYSVGASLYKVASQTSLVTDSYFMGNIDEVRVWNASLSADGIKQIHNHKLSGSEVALQAYYPFEIYTKDEGNQWVITETMADQVNGSKSVATASSTAPVYSDLTAAIQLPRQIENIPFTYTANERGIVITPTAELSTIEGTTLTFAVNNVQDVNGNYLASPLVWTELVNKNQLVWDGDEQSLTKVYGDALSVEATIMNNSANTENYAVTGMPSWLTCSQSSGSLSAQKSRTLKFVVNNALAIGSYEVPLLLTGNNNYAEPYTLNISVTGGKPNWNVEAANYEKSMTVTAVLKKEGVNQEDENDLVAAFVGNECRGVISPKYIASADRYYTFLTVYGDKVDSGKDVTFRMWDAGTGTTYPIVESDSLVKFVSDKSWGTLKVPVVLNARDYIEQTITLNKGWNWISANVENTSDDLYKQFISGIADKGLTILDGSAYSQYDGTQWLGNGVSAWTNTHSYLIQTSAATTIPFIGKAVPVATSIALNKGWNNIAYLPQTTMTVDEALAPIALQENEQIRSQKEFALYSAQYGVWMGSLKTMSPGTGYKFCATADKSFAYPATNSLSGNRAKGRVAATGNYWTANASDYAHLMTMVANVFVDGKELTGESYELGAFDANNVCRGSIMLYNQSQLNSTLAFLMMYGNDGENLNFRLYDHSTDKEITGANSISFTTDATLGSLDNRYKIEFSTTGINEANAGTMSVWPQPAVSELNYRVPFDHVSVVETYDMNGRLLNRIENPQSGKIDVSSFTPGKYILRVFSEDHSLSRLWIKK
jgi:hypothetical protein